MPNKEPILITSIEENKRLVNFKTGMKNTIPDIIFIFLPLIIISLVYLFSGSKSNIFYHAEWSFASSVLFGQSIVKLIASISECDTKLKGENIAIFITVIIAFLLIPQSNRIGFHADNGSSSIVFSYHPNDSICNFITRIHHNWRY